MTQHSLFEESAHARRTDPETSHEAAASVKHLRESQRAVLSMFSPYAFGLTDEELIVKYRTTGTRPLQSDSGIRTRRSELVHKGWLYDSGDRALTVSGRRTIVWRRTI